MWCPVKDLTIKYSACTEHIIIIAAHIKYTPLLICLRSVNCMTVCWCEAVIDCMLVVTFSIHCVERLQLVEQSQGSKEDYSMAVADLSLN